LDERRQQVVARRGPAPLDEVEHEVDHLLGGRPARLGPLGVHDEDLGAPSTEVAAPALLDAEQLADHLDRERVRERGHHVGVGGLGHRVEQTVDDLLHAGPHRHDPARRELPRDELAQPGVAGRVAGAHVVHEVVLGAVAEAEVGREVDVDVGVLGLRVAAQAQVREGGPGLLVPGHEPRVLAEEPDGRDGPTLAQLGVRVVPVDVEGVGVQVRHLRQRRHDTTSNRGRGNTSDPPPARNSASRSTKPSR
jgi:hypothetical protein